MEMFALNEEVAALENRLAASRDAARLPLLIELAWHLRQRDCERALQCAQEADTHTTQACLTPRLNTNATAPV